MSPPFESLLRYGARSNGPVPIPLRCALPVLLAAICFSTSLPAQQVVAQDTTAEVTTAQGSAQFPSSGEVSLNARYLVHWVVARNADALYAQLQAKVNQRLYEGEQALYEPKVYLNLKHQDTHRLRTAEEKASSALTSNLNELKEQDSTMETGVRRLLPSGAELTASYRLARTRSNIIAGAADQLGSEYDGALNLSLKQPLLRGRGRGITEADLKVAKLERDIGALEYQDKVLQTAADALVGYWKLYAADAVYAIRQQALDNVQAIDRDVHRRVEAGRLPRTEQLESKIAVASRQAELARATQALADAQTRIKLLLNLSGDFGQLRLQAGQAPDTEKVETLSAAQRFKQSVDNWPKYRIARLKREQEGLRLAYADDEKKPSLDLLLGYSRTSLDGQMGSAARNVLERNYPDWYVGLNLEMPIGGNGKAVAQYGAQQERVRKSELQIQSARNDLANDIQRRAVQLQSALGELRQLQEEVRLRAQLLETERTQYRMGKVRLSQVLDREHDLNVSRQRQVESAVRLELARVALHLADGSLLAQYAIQVDY